MKLYKVSSGILVEYKDVFYHLEGTSWDGFINDDRLLNKLKIIVEKETKLKSAKKILAQGLDAPMQSQEIWACGLNYADAKAVTNGSSTGNDWGSVYSRAYEADRPDLFFKAAKSRTVGSGGKVKIRKDSEWNVPEPELTLLITSNKKIIGYTIGNDMSSRSLESENPLYLTQAKTYDACASIGPCIYLPDEPLDPETEIEMEILRGGEIVFEEITGIERMKRPFDTLVDYLYRETTFPQGCMLMTGTGIVPPGDFTLQSGDEIRITIDPIGTLVNTVL